MNPVGSAFVVLCAARLRVRTQGISRTLAWACRLPSPRPAPHGSASVDEALQVAEGVAMAGALFPGRARCLEQSLALTRLLRLRGIPAELRFGVRPHPFAAHAWVEVEGEPLLEDRERLSTFEPVSRP